MDWNAALSALAWQVDLGADEAIGDAPVNRYAVAAEARAAAQAKTAPAAAAVAPAHPAPPAHSDVPGDPADEARTLALAAQTLDDLRLALAGFERCDLRHGARSLVFADGDPRARVMVVGEAPGREEDLEGRPFVGKAGQLLDRMLAAIGLDRTSPDPGAAVYITNVLPWRPPQNRDPAPDEVAMMLPFVTRHIELADPEILVLVGNHACQALLGRRGILRLRGGWTEAVGRPALPMLHPAYLLRTPAAKREAWADLLSLRARLDTGTPP